MMKTRRALLAAGIGAALAVGAFGEASASIYAGSKMNIRNLVINVSDVAGPAPSNFPVQSWNFNLLNIAALNGVTDATTGSCSGGPGPGTCTPIPPNVGPGVLSAGPAEVGTNQGVQQFNFVGPNSGGEYSRADSVITTAELAGDPSTATTNIAEAELQTGVAGSGSSNVQSTTGFDFVFVAPTGGVFSIEFEADPALMASIVGPLPPDTTGANATANHSLQVKFNQTTGTGAGASITWNPTNPNAGVNPCEGAGSDGDVTILGTGISCSGAGDGEYNAEDLNNDVTVSAVGTSDSASFPGQPDDQLWGSYGLQFHFTNAGTYSLSLTESKVVTVSRTTAATPEPGTILLLGSGFLTAGLLRRSRQRKTAEKNA